MLIHDKTVKKQNWTSPAPPASSFLTRIFCARIRNNQSKSELKRELEQVVLWEGAFIGELGIIEIRAGSYNVYFL